MKTVYVVSDLHMFCRRSQWEKHLDAIHEAATVADMFIFNGDTVDFKWSCFSTVSQTVLHAVRFFRELATKYPRCNFHVNLGNHDHVQPFIFALDALAREVDNFSWHPYYLRINNTIFLHGDVANRKMSHHQLERYRRRWDAYRNRRQGQIKNRVYDAAFRAGAHVAISKLAFPHRRTVKRVVAYLEDIGHASTHGVEQVYFGHTHVPISGYQYGGVVFHNGGAPMEGIGFQLLKAVV
ncbi:MAG: metallophosphoesterase [Candidatus Hydrogenedentes bacterium]|nr:metallophosphoesterase [Candidatus Hydrogenedentota bacterium]